VCLFGIQKIISQSKFLGSKKLKDIWGTEISIWRTDGTPNSNDFFESKKLKRGNLFFVLEKNAFARGVYRPYDQQMTID